LLCSIGGVVIRHTTVTKVVRWLSFRGDTYIANEDLKKIANRKQSVVKRGLQNRRQNRFGR
jgi:hypothetical protein